MYTHEFVPGDTWCCVNCSKRASFKPVMEIKSLGVSILRYESDVFTKVIPQQATEVFPGHIHDTKNNIFIIINRNEKKICSEDILPKLNINEVPCLRCRYKANKIQKMLQSNVDVAKGDIRGICDHCKDKISQRPCPTCADIVKKFIDATNAVQASTFDLKEAARYVHDPLSTVGKADSEEMYYPTMAKPKSATELKRTIQPVTELFKSKTIPAKHRLEKKPFEFGLKQAAPYDHDPLFIEEKVDSDEKYYLTKAKPRSATELKRTIPPVTELFKSKTIPVKYGLDKKSIEDKRKVAPKICKFPSDESIITPFVTSFSNAEKDMKGSFEYVFPRDVEKKKGLTKAALATSSELILDTQQKFLKQLEEINKNESQKITTDLDRTPGRTDKLIIKAQDFEYDGLDNISEDEKLKKLKQRPSLVSSTYSKETIKKTKGIPKLDKQKEIRVETVGKEKVGLPDKEETKKEHVGKTSKEKDIAQEMETKLPEEKRSDKDKDHVGKQIKNQELVGQPSYKDTKIKGQEDIRKPSKVGVEPSSRHDKTVKYKEEIRKQPYKDAKGENDQRDIVKPSKQHPPKDIKDKKEPEPEHIGKPPSKDIKAKKDQENIGEPQPKDSKTEKDQQEKPPPKPSQQLPKDVSLKKGIEDSEKVLSKEEKAKRESEHIEKPSSKEVKGKKYQDDIGEPQSKDSRPKKDQKEKPIPKPPQQPAKDVSLKKGTEDSEKVKSKEGKAKKESEHIEKPSLKEVKGKKDQDGIGEPQSKDLRTMKDQKEKPLPKPPQQPSKDVGLKKGMEDSEKVLAREGKAKKESEYIGKPSSKEVKVKKDQDDIGEPQSKDSRTKKDQKEKPLLKLPQQPPKDVSLKKGIEDNEKVLTKEGKAKIESKHIEKPSSKELKKDQENIGKPQLKDGKVRKDQEHTKKPPSTDVKTKKDENSIKNLPKPTPQPPKIIEKDKQGTSAEERKADRKLEKGKEKTDKRGTATEERRADKELEKGKEKTDKRGTGTEERRADRELEKGKEKTGKVMIEGNKDDNENYVEKAEKTKSDIQSQGKKGKAKTGETSTERAQLEKDIPKRSPSILKLMPTKVMDIKVINALDKNKALAAAHVKIKEMEEQCLHKARADAEKRSHLPEFHSNHNLFKIRVKEPPLLDYDGRPVRKKFDLNKMVLGRPSLENALKVMLKVCKEKERKIDKKKRKHQAKYKIRSAKQHSPTTFSIDSDLELDLESLTNLKKGKRVCYKIKYTNIVRDVPEKPKSKLQPDPILYHTVEKDEPLLVQDLEGANEPEKGDLENLSGITRYTLSDRSYIAKGWTVLPTEKIIRQINIYKIRPANPEFDWFNHNRKKGSLQYCTGERLATFDEDGRGRLYYKNGRMALDYYDCEEANAQQRFVVYSSGESSERCRSLPVTVLAMFDYLGSGVVFDHTGKIRVKYNQTEGVVLDRGIGPVTRWKWHTLNDPPVLKQVMIDTRIEDPDIQKLGGDEHKNRLFFDENMLKIELENFAKEKIKKLSQDFQPFQIKMKSLKINDQFSLKILDQAHVYLYFNDGLSHVKINLGMVIDNKQIIDTETSDYAKVSNSLEKALPKTESLLFLQNNIKQVRRCEQMRVAYNERVQRTVPICSADKLVSAVSKPLRPPLGTTCPVSTEQANVQRKPSQCNMYHVTRLI